MKIDAAGRIIVPQKRGAGRGTRPSPAQPASVLSYLPDPVPGELEVERWWDSRKSRPSISHWERKVKGEISLWTSRFLVDFGRGRFMVLQWYQGMWADDTPGTDLIDHERTRRYARLVDGDRHPRISNDARPEDGERGFHLQCHGY